MAMTLFLAACASQPSQDSHWNNLYQNIARNYGWLPEFNRGREIMRELNALSPAKLEKLDVATYRGEQVALVGSGPSPYAANNLLVLAPGGFYVHVVNSSGKDLRPATIWWKVMLRGRVKQLIPNVKIIVLEVDDKDWRVIESG